MFSVSRTVANGQTIYQATSQLIFCPGCSVGAPSDWNVSYLTSGGVMIATEWIDATGVPHDNGCIGTTDGSTLISTCLNAIKVN